MNDTSQKNSSFKILTFNSSYRIRLVFLQFWWFGNDCPLSLKQYTLKKLIPQSHRPNRQWLWSKFQSIAKCLKMVVYFIYGKVCFTTVTSYVRYGVSDHWRLDCLFNNLFGLTTKKTSKRRITSPLEAIVFPHNSKMITSSNGNIFRVTGPFVGNSSSPVNSPQKGQWRGALMFSLIRGPIH